MRDTIVAVATGTATSAVAIVRLSGPAADDVLTLLTDRPLPTPRMASVRVLVDRDGQVLDEALVLRFLAGASYTGEPVVELHCHGGRAVVRAVLATILSEPGLRLAEPGEFSRRAFEAGRLDLAQVEALGDLIAAETEAQRKQAMLGFRGALHAMAAEWRADLLRAAALIEATIDWADEDVPEDVGEEVTRLIARVRAGLAQEKARVGAAMALRQGYEVALVGAPNVGKSSLLNALAGREAAITSPTPGTTRDVIELRYDLQGLPVIFLDMAGIRETADLVEAKGVNRARERAREATLRLFLQAPGIALVEGALKQPGDLIVWAKADLSPGPGDVVVSVELGSGIAELLAAIAEVLSARVEEAGVVGHIRQQSALLAAERVLDCTPVSPEELAEAVRSAMRALDGLIGRLGVEDVLGEVFSTFCLGK